MTYTPRLFRPDPAREMDAVKTAPYLFSDQALAGVDVALASGRPLLIAGVPGCGKTTLARAVAKRLGWRYLHETVTSRTRLDGLTIGFDSLRRLKDAQLREGTLPPDWTYREPGVLWWAFNEETAKRRGASDADWAAWPDTPRPESPAEEGAEPHAVVLLDEIDKADLDLPNDLLEPLDRRSFSGYGAKVSAGESLKTLVMLTTNGERELPPAFLRRCLVVTIVAPDDAALAGIAEMHCGTKAKKGLVTAMIRALRDEQARAKQDGRREPATAEFLDAMSAVIELGIADDQTAWEPVLGVAMRKVQPTQ
ncbi:MAG: MoxR family ATPase [Alphaproteobacteria bacterium]|nr:MoxR family ATPase [Alphaproteobacteria bacterium]